MIYYLFSTELSLYFHFFIFFKQISMCWTYDNVDVEIAFTGKQMYLKELLIMIIKLIIFTHYVSVYWICIMKFQINISH